MPSKRRYLTKDNGDAKGKVSRFQKDTLQEIMNSSKNLELKMLVFYISSIKFIRQWNFQEIQCTKDNLNHISCINITLTYWMDKTI